jgi:hypothetical protein
MASIVDQIRVIVGEWMSPLRMPLAPTRSGNTLTELSLAHDLRIDLGLRGRRKPAKADLKILPAHFISGGYLALRTANFIRLLPQWPRRKE